MKRILALILAVCLLFALTACKPSDVKYYTIGVAIFDFNNNFMTLYRNEIEKYIKSLETDKIKFNIIMSDGKNDMAEQSNQIDNFITQQADVIICNLVQTSSADVIIDRVNRAKIPLVLINREPLGDNGKESYPGIIENPTVCYVGADAKQSGTFQGEIVRDLDNHGDVNGDGVISYIMIQGDPENPDAKDRTEMSIKALTDAGYKVNCLDSQIANWDQAKAQEICSTALAKYGKDIEVVFCNNDSMALGSYTAINTAGRTVNKDIYLLGVDGLDECVEMIEKDEMTGTVKNDHVAQAKTAVDVAIDLIQKKPIQNYYWIDYLKISKKTLEQSNKAS